MSEDLVARLQADGELQSSGRFSWDFQRLGSLLKVQLADPEHYVLRALASAVLGKASYFRIVQKGLNTRIRWDGQEVTEEDLQELSPVGGPPRLAELAVALLAAGRLGRVEFAWVEGEARLWLARSGWRNLFGRGRTLKLLAERGCYAPLQMDVPLAIFSAGRSSVSFRQVIRRSDWVKVTSRRSQCRAPRP